MTDRDRVNLQRDADKIRGDIRSALGTTTTAGGTRSSVEPENPRTLTRIPTEGSGDAETITDGRPAPDTSWIEMESITGPSPLDTRNSLKLAWQRIRSVDFRWFALLVVLSFGTVHVTGLIASLIPPGPVRELVQLTAIFALIAWLAPALRKARR